MKKYSETFIKFFPLLQLLNLAFTMGMIIASSWSHRSFFTGLWTGVFIAHSFVYLFSRMREARMGATKEMLDKFKALHEGMFAVMQPEKEKPSA